MLRRSFQPLAWTGFCLIGCSAAMAQQPAKTDAPKEKGVAAYVGNDPITLQELDDRALKTNMKLAQSLYDARKAILDQVVMEKILGAEAAEKKTTVEKLMADRVAEKTKPVTDADIDAYFKANSARMGGKTLDQVTGQIRTFLVSQNEKTAKDALMAELKGKANIRVLLDAPRVEVAVAANDPVKGPATAKVTIIEFSEFQ